MGKRDVRYELTDDYCDPSMVCVKVTSDRGIYVYAVPREPIILVDNPTRSRR